MKKKLFVVTKLTDELGLSDMAKPVVFASLAEAVDHVTAEWVKTVHEEFSEYEDEILGLKPGEDAEGGDDAYMAIAPDVTGAYLEQPCNDFDKWRWDISEVEIPT